VDSDLNIGQVLGVHHYLVRRAPDGYVNGGISAEEQCALVNIAGYVQLVEQRIGFIGQAQGSLSLVFRRQGSVDHQGQGHQ